MTDIFSFWAIPASTKVHPADESSLGRMNHAFNLDCLPSPSLGPLRTAEVVLLFLSPGLVQFDVDEASTVSGQERYARQRRGDALLPSPDEHLEAWEWWSQRTALFGAWQDLRNKIAILNLAPYHASNFGHYGVIGSLASCRACLDWAQTELFPQAFSDERIVICLRATRYWGLEPGKQYLQSLYAPAVTPGGHMLHGELRDEIVRKVRNRIGSSKASR